MQYSGIVSLAKTGRFGRLKIDKVFAPQQSRNDVLIQVCIGLKAYCHRGKASRSFFNSSKRR